MRYCCELSYVVQHCFDKFINKNACMKKMKFLLFIIPVLTIEVFTGCNNNNSEQPKEEPKHDSSSAQTEKKKEPVSQPLVSHIYTADPSAHVFNGRIYIYPSHDTATGTPEDDLGSHFNMMDYHILSMDAVGGPVTDHGVALDIKNVSWAGRQMWAPDA